MNLDVLMTGRYVVRAQALAAMQDQRAQMRSTMRHLLTATGLLTLLALLLAGCADADNSQCQIGAECASGICRSDGTCQPLAEDMGDGDTQGEDQGDLTADMAGDAVEEVAQDLPADAAPDSDPDGAPDAPTDDMDAEADAPPDGCRPVRDGVLERAELPFAPGLSARFRSTQGADVDLAGATVEGQRRWDFSGALPGDHLTLIETQPVADKWFADDFPTADYAARLTDAEELLGVFRWEGDALTLLGVVSPQDGFTATKLTYDPPVTVLQLPLREGDTWEVDTNVSGTALGIFSFYSEAYVYRVDASGEVVTPFGAFSALRVRAELTRTVGLLTTRVRSYLFLTECFGTVAAVVSEDNESDLEFTRAAEIRRLAP
jgi:hypothetical protein